MVQQYFEESPDVASDPKKVAATINGNDYIFETDRGVFSYEKVDKATQILLSVFDEKFYGKTPKNVVDLGCGYGPIACVIAKRFTDSHIVAVDINERARALCEKNYKDNIDDDRLTVIAPDEITNQKINLIISNPPVRIGKASLYELLQRWSTRLADDGQLWFVMAKNLGADSTAEFLARECNLHVHRVASKKGFRVIRCSPVR